MLRLTSETSDYHIPEKSNIRPLKNYRSFHKGSSKIEIDNDYLSSKSNISGHKIGVSTPHTVTL